MKRKLSESSWKERMPRPLQASVNFWYQYITKNVLLLNLSSYPISILIWDKVPATYLTHMNVLHNRSIRCICKISRAAYTSMLDLHHSCKILQINQIQEYELRKFMYKIVHNFIPGFISCCYSDISDRHNYLTIIASNNNFTTISSEKNSDAKVYTIHTEVADPDQAFGEGKSNKGAPKSLHLFKYPSFSATIVGYHTKVVTFSRPRKWLSLVELCNLSGNHQSLKSPFIINSQKVWSRLKKIGLLFHKLHITENPMDVTKNILYLHQVFKRYTLRQWSPTLL